MGASTDGAQCPGRRALALVLFCAGEHGARLVLPNQSTRGAKRPFFYSGVLSWCPPPRLRAPAATVVLACAFERVLFVELNKPRAAPLCPRKTHGIAFPYRQGAFPSGSRADRAPFAPVSIGAAYQLRSLVRGPWAVLPGPCGPGHGPYIVRDNK